MAATNVRASWFRSLRSSAPNKNALRIVSSARDSANGTQCAVPKMITPVDERILEVDATILDIDERSQQVDDGGERFGHWLSGSVRQLTADAQQRSGGTA